ncbi:MAG: hypothetical protein H6707_02150 [Deltaproteobacteria bacterium]|nr:hypothetical protein [Deltaproteobacteria bacterium]
MGDEETKVGRSGELLDTMLSAENRDQRRAAFLELLASNEWRQCLAPHVLSSQGYQLGQTFHPDLQTFSEAAALIAKDEQKIEHTIQLAGARFSGELLVALAEKMGSELVEHLLAHLPGSDDSRGLLLLYVLNEADNGWVKRADAKPLVAALLRSADVRRLTIMTWLGNQGCLSDYVQLLHQLPPTRAEEWAVLGRSGLQDEQLIDLALAKMPRDPAPLLYLLRLNPVPDRTLLRLLASARGGWTAAALELVAIDGVNSAAVIPLAEMGVRMGGRALAAATAWINVAKLSRELLRLFSDTPGSCHQWVRKRAPSADRALLNGRQGIAPDIHDAAALVRQLNGEAAADLACEILQTPLTVMIDTVLNPLVAVDPYAARAVLDLCDTDNDSELVGRAQAVRLWNDVQWPEQRADMPTMRL